MASRYGARARSLGVLVVASGLIGAPTAARAQVLSGRIVDAESGAPVVLAYVGLLAPGRELVVAKLTDTDGSFSLRAPRRGSYLLYVDRTGYAAVLDGLYELGEGGSIDLRIGLRATPVPLEPLYVGVSAPRRDLTAVGFHERRMRGLGHFLVREEIERVAIEDVTDALRGIPRLVVTTPAPEASRPTGVLNPELLIRSGTESCSPSLYVDGHLVAHGGRPGSPVRPDDYVDPASVEAVEVYTSPAETPVEYETATGCGVVLVWTR